MKRNKLNVLPNNPEEERGEGRSRFPSWLHRKLPEGSALFETTSLLKKASLNTVCEEAKCPNRLECYANQTATFLAMGKACTRACGFCDIDFSKQPKKPDPKEPAQIAESVKKLQLRHVVITMVARDDLPDQGVSHMRAIVQAVREENPGVTIELLTSDFSGDESLLSALLEARPEIFNHNIETVERLTPKVRHKATYARTLKVLAAVKADGRARFVKSGIMVGLGESEEEVQHTLCDLKEVGCAIITIGQYLQASRHKLTVKSFISPEQFKRYETYGHQIGVRYMYCGPFVRSSYNASLLKERAFKGEA